MLAPTGNAKQGLARENKPRAAVSAGSLHLPRHRPAGGPWQRRRAGQVTPVAPAPAVPAWQPSFYCAY